MAWNIDATMVELCSCNAMCPCWLGPDTLPDQGWCGGAFLFDIEQGTVDGVDVSGCRAALAANWPGNFFAGNGTARIYLDSAASDAQRNALEAVLSGKKGSVFGAVFGQVIANWLPAKATAITIDRGEALSALVEGAGQARITPYKDASGRTATATGTLAQGALQSPSMEIASAKGSRWTDADFQHSWEGDSGTIHKMHWASE